MGAACEAHLSCVVAYEGNLGGLSSIFEGCAVGMTPVCLSVDD